jgi:hypothetical protein
MYALLRRTDRLVDGAGGIKLTKDGKVLLTEMVKHTSNGARHHQVPTLFYFSKFNILLPP